MSNNIGMIRGFERAFMTNGKLSSGEAKALTYLAKTGTAQDKAAVKTIFENDKFEAGVDVKKLAQEAGIAKIEPSKVMKAEVGKGIDPTTQKEVKATVAAVIGEPGGYANKFQAIAAARLNLGQDVSVIKDGGRYYAVQTTPPVSKPSGDTIPIQPLDLEAYDKVKNGSLPTREKYTKLAAMAFGVPEDQINVFNSKNSEAPDAKKINIDLGMDTSKNGETGMDKGEAAQGMVNGKPGVVSLSTNLLDNDGPMRASTTLFHEGTHAADRALANEVLEKMGGTFDQTKFNKVVYGPKSPYDAMQKRVLSEEFGVADGGGSTSDKYMNEAHAYASALIEAAGIDPKGLKDQAIGLGAELAGGKIKSTDASFKELAKHLRAGFDKLSSASQDDVIAAIKSGMANNSAQRDMVLAALTK